MMVNKDYEEWETELATKEFMREEMLDLKKDFADLRNDIVKSKNALIRWMFIFSVGYIIAFLMVILLFVKK